MTIETKKLVISEELKTNLNRVITTINNSPDKITFLKKLEQIRSNNNAYAFDRYLSIIIKKLELSTKEKFTLLNLDIPYYQTLGLWNKLTLPSKLAYLDSKNFLSNLDIKRINYTINKKKRFNYTQNNDAEKIIRLIGIGDKRKKDNFKLGVITLDLSMFKDKDEKEIYKKLFDKLEKERLT